MGRGVRAFRARTPCLLSSPIMQGVNIMQLMRSVQNFIRDEEGAVAIEYALVAAGIAAIVAVFFGSGGAGGFTQLLADLFGKIAAAASKT